MAYRPTPEERKKLGLPPESQDVSASTSTPTNLTNAQAVGYGTSVAQAGGTTVPVNRSLNSSSKPGALPEEQLQTKPTVLRDEAGRINGVILPGREALVGIGNKEVRALIDDYERRRETPIGAQEFEPNIQNPLLAGRAQAQNIPTAQQQPQQISPFTQGVIRQNPNLLIDLIAGRRRFNTREEFVQNQLGEATGLAGKAGIALGGVAAAGLIPEATSIAVLGKSAGTVSAASHAGKVAGIFSKLKTLGEGILFGSIGLKIIGQEPFKNKAPFIQQSFNTLGEEANSIANDPILTPQAKLRELENIEKQVAAMEVTLSVNNIENRRLVNTKEMLDILTDLNEKKKEIALAKAQAQSELLQQQYPQYSEETINRWVSEATEEDLDKLSEEYNRQVNKILGV